MRAGTPSDWTQWTHVAEISLESGDEKYGKLTLVPQIYDISRRELNDIRIIASDGLQIPYVLFRASDKSSIEEFYPAELNRGVTTTGAASLTVDFGKQEIKDAISVNTEGNNFRRRVEVEGSNDNIDFLTLMKKGYVFAVPHNGGAQKFQSINLPRNDFRYLRISVYPDGIETVTISKIHAWRKKEVVAPRQLVEMVPLGQQEDQEKQSSMFIYDLQFQNLPLTEIKLDTADESFYRYVTIEGRDQATRKIEISGEDNRQRFREVEVPWRYITSGTIYKYQTNEGDYGGSTSLSIGGKAVPRYIRVAIKNYDDKPLSITSVRGQMLPHELVFPRPNDNKCTVYIGCANARPPKYDLQHTLRQPQSVRAGSVSIVNIRPNTLFREAPGPVTAWTEKHQVIFRLVLVAAVLVLGGFIVRSLKSILSQKNQGQ